MFKRLILIFFLACFFTAFSCFIFKSYSFACTQGASQCSGGSSYQICNQTFDGVNYNWSSSTNCSAEQSCLQGVCRGVCGDVNNGSSVDYNGVRYSVRGSSCSTWGDGKGGCNSAMPISGGYIGITTTNPLAMCISNGSWISNPACCAVGVSNCPGTSGNFCDASCNLYAPACSGTTWVRGSIIQNNSSSCNGIVWNTAPWYGPMNCPTGKPTNLNATQSCSVPTNPSGAFTWTNASGNTSTKFWYCDQTKAAAHNPAVACTTGSQPTTDGSEAGWYILINPATSGLTLNGSTTRLPLAFGHTFSWFVTGVNADGSTADSDHSTFTPNTCNPITNGVCNATHYTCTTGTSVSNVSGQTQWTWTCNGLNGGASAACTQDKPGACSATHYTCTTGTSSGTTGDTTTQWKWNCNGSTNASCTENKPAVNGACAATHNNCSAGSLGSTADYSSQWQWWCNGANGGNNMLCTENKPTFNASGEVYVDLAKNGQLDGADSGYAGARLTICAGNQPGGCGSPVETLTTTANGAFNTAGVTPLLSGQYTALLTIPSGYQAILPKPPIAIFTVGTAATGNTCSANSPASCDANGNVSNLNFGISNSLPWMQVIGGDIISNGFTDNIPQTADLTCSGGAYASAVGAGGTPGVVNTGSAAANFGQGQASARNWLVGGLGAGSYPYVYNLPLSQETRTAYGNLTYLVGQSNIPTQALNTIPGCSNYASCTLPPTSTNFPSGAYTVNGNLILNSANGTYTFPDGGKYVILVNGILTINTKIYVPVGSFALFSAADNIDIASIVGDTSHVTASNLEGYYSTDKSFIIQGQDPNGQGANCATNSEDLRLNAAGAIVVDAVTSNGGTFSYQRDMCANDKVCPVFTISERPDFVLNSPTFLMFPRRVWQQVAP